MRTRNAVALSTAILAAMAAASLAVGPRLPETMVTHWNAAGQPDDTMPKLWGQFLLPAVGAGLLLVLFVAPKIDPRKKNIEAFRPLYDEFVVVTTAFLALIHAVVLAVNLGYDVPVGRVIYAGVGLLILYLGFVLDSAEQNWVVGIRTPWTLSDEAVWNRTHELGARLFKLSGLVAVLGAFAPAYAIVLVVGPVLVSSLFLFVYSYYLFEQQPETESSASQ